MTVTPIGIGGTGPTVGAARCLVADRPRHGIRAEVAAAGIPFADAVKMGAFTEPKDGVIDFVAFRQVLVDVAFAGIGIVEQDLYPTAFDRPYPIAVSTRSYLSDIGMA